MKHLDETLVAKFLAGEASPEEAIKVNDWIEESYENKTYFKELESAWLLNTKIEGASPGRSSAWHALKNEIDINKKPSPFFTLYRIAATLLLTGCLVGAYFFSRPGKPQTSWITRQTLNEVASFNLSDGTAVTVNRKSKLMWPTQFQSAIREVRLDGEAFFDVTRNPEKPFIIAADEIKIKVLGTAFNVQQDKQNNEIKVDVVRGKVMVYNSEKSIVIEAGMIGIYHKETKDFTLLKMQNENTMAYASHSLSFSNATLKVVSEQLSKAYGVQFNFENKKVQECELTTAYQNKSLSFIMNVIAESLDIKYYIKDNIVYVSGNGCL